VPVDTIDAVAEDVALGDVVEIAGRLLGGEIKGRVIVDVNR
jgi:acrylyl-CoA reductase (NADPH)